jgi:sorting nexin-4
MESQMAEPLDYFAKEIGKHCEMIHKKVLDQDISYVSELQETVAHCQAAKETLKLRDQKQVDHEELQRFLDTLSLERDRTMSTGKSPGISGFFQDKINDFKGIDPEKTRQERLGKLEIKITEVCKLVI